MTGTYENLIAQLDKLRKHNRQGSYKTRERYYEAMQRFSRYLADEFKLQKLSNIAPKHVYAYVSHMQTKGLAASTIKTDLAAIRFWHDKLSDTKYPLPDNERLTLERRSFGNADRTWPEEAFDNMLAICREQGRDDFAAALIIAQYAGLRVHECFRIDTAAAKRAIRENALTIKGKGGKIRSVPIPKIVREELIKLLDVTPRGRKLFVKEGVATRIAIAELQRFLREHRGAALDGESLLPLHYHGLRHGYAARSYKTLKEHGEGERGARKQVSRLLGHNRPEITGIYLASLRDGLLAAGGI